jgi:hypothetical protein
MEGAFLQSFHKGCNRALVAQSSGLDRREHWGTSDACDFCVVDEPNGAQQPGVNRSVRSFTFIACLSVLADPLGVLSPTWALAQTTETVEASRAKKTQKGRSNAPRTAPPPPTNTRDEGLAPAPPSFYSVSQLGDHLSSVRWELAAVGAGLVAVGIRDWDWGGSEFEFIEEGWFAKNTRHGGMDKIGHAFSTYVIADILTDRIRANAANPAGAPITGALVAFGIMGLGETLDGFTGKHRFSREDIVANGVGAAFAILRNSVPGLREKLDWRIMYTPASYELPGITASEESGILPPYQRQRYIMALKGSGFDELKTTPLRYVELHAGFDARGFELDERRRGYPIERTFYVGVGLNLNEVLFGAGPVPNFAKHKDTLPARVVQKTFEYIQVPYTAAYHGNRFSTIRRQPSTPSDPVQ